MTSRSLNLRGLFFAALLAATSLAAQAQQAEPQSTVAQPLNVTQSMLHSPIGENWTSYNGDYTGSRFTRLKQITPSNVHQLRAQWVFHTPVSSNLEVTPVVINGIMFVTASNDAYALDARTGRVIWHYSRPISEGLIDDASGHLNRGVAVLGSRVYMNTDNAHLLCLDIRSGHLIWDVAYADWNKNYGATSAPLVVKDKIIVGTSGGDDGVRGFVAAYEADSGKLAWRFWTIPAPGEFGSESWPGDSYLHGGGTAWMPGTFDPELNLLYWTTSNASPDFNGEGRPGDDLYTSCVVALDPDTGKLKWYFQFTPHDLYDYDATQTPILVDASYKGKPRKLMLQANRNGFIYILDRATGEFLSATQFAKKLNWADGIDAKGRPIITAKSARPTPEGSVVCPGFVGATNWYSPSYNPLTRQLFFLSEESCTTLLSGEQEFEEGKTYYSTGAKRASNEHGQKFLNAFDLDSQKIVWTYPQVGQRGTAGVMSTATGLVFFGNTANDFEAVDARTGKSLWHFNTGQFLHASPMSFAVDGKQHVAIAAGGNVFTFALPDAAVR